MSVIDPNYFVQTPHFQSSQKQYNTFVSYTFHIYMYIYIFGYCLYPQVQTTAILILLKQGVVKYQVGLRSSDIKGMQ